MCKLSRKCYCALERNVIGKEGVKLLFHALINGNKTLKHLNLDYNSLGVEGAKYIAEDINKVQAPLESLSLGNNELKD